MKVAIVYNRESQRVINLFGMPNQEKYGKRNIQRVVDALKSGGHQVQAFEGDKDLIENLEKFMPRVVKGERPGMVFNLSYGIQGQARYTHVPGMLEMLGLPYVGSGPLAHSLALDKVVSKMIFRQNKLPTPDFAVLQDENFELPELKYPLIVKPKNESVSFGIRVCKNEAELREGAGVIFKKFSQPVLVEQYIDGREINVGIIGNQPAEVFPPAEITFGTSGPKIYTYEDKTRKSGRTIEVVCPADLSPEQTELAKKVAKGAFDSLGCYDCARVDMRLDKDGNFYILEINSLPSLGEHGSYVEGAAQAGLDFAGLVNRLVDVASARYFGTPTPPTITTASSASSGEKVFNFLTERRDQLERQVQHWIQRRSRTGDPVGIQTVASELNDDLTELKLEPVQELTSDPHVWTWQSAAGLDGGTLLLLHLDVPSDPSLAVQMFRREPEWLHGDGIGSSRAPLVSMLFALRALRHLRRLRKIPMGVMAFADEGYDCRHSAEWIRKAAAKAKNVLVLRPGNLDDRVVSGRRGQRVYQLRVEGKPQRAGKAGTQIEVLRWLFEKLESCSKLSKREQRLGVSTLELKSEHMPMLLPHQATARLLVSYPDEASADQLEEQIRKTLDPKSPVAWDLRLISKRPPMAENRASTRLFKSLKTVAEQWEIPLRGESSVWPSVAGLVPASVGVVCGVGPVTRDLYTPNEAVNRVSLTQRTLLLAGYLAEQVRENETAKK